VGPRLRRSGRPARPRRRAREGRASRRRSPRPPRRGRRAPRPARPLDRRPLGVAVAVGLVDAGAPPRAEREDARIVARLEPRLDREGGAGELQNDVRRREGCEPELRPGREEHPFGLEVLAEQRGQARQLVAIDQQRRLRRETGERDRPDVPRDSREAADARQVDPARRAAEEGGLDDGMGGDRLADRGGPRRHPDRFEHDGRVLVVAVERPGRGEGEDLAEASLGDGGRRLVEVEPRVVEALLQVGGLLAAHREDWVGEDVRALARAEPERRAHLVGGEREPLAVRIAQLAPGFEGPVEEQARGRSADGEGSRSAGRARERLEQAPLPGREPARFEVVRPEAAALAARPHLDEEPSGRLHVVVEGRLDREDEDRGPERTGRPAAPPSREGGLEVAVREPAERGARRFGAASGSNPRDLSAAWAPCRSVASSSIGAGFGSTCPRTASRCSLEPASEKSRATTWGQGGAFVSGHSQWHARSPASVTPTLAR
jgi:hypothetical protein